MLMASPADAACIRFMNFNLTSPGPVAGPWHHPAEQDLQRQLHRREAAADTRHSVPTARQATR